MRLAPVPLFYARDPANAVRMSGESSRTTHGDGGLHRRLPVLRRSHRGGRPGRKQGDSAWTEVFPGGGSVGPGPPVP